MTGTQTHPVNILLVEDSPGDVRLTKEALREGRLSTKLHVVGDGEEALAFLRKIGNFCRAPRPHIILMDLNLPKKDGRELLAEIKQDPDLRRIPVVVLTTSRAEEDVLKVYNLHANCYITKPMALEKYLEVVKSIEEFWLVLAKLPPF